MSSAFSGMGFGCMRQTHATNFVDAYILPKAVYTLYEVCKLHTSQTPPENGLSHQTTPALGSLVDRVDCFWGSKSETAWLFPFDLPPERG